MRALRLAATLGAVLLLAGCGSAPRDVRTTTDGFFTALDRKDGAAACALLAETASSALEHQEKQPCAKAILDADIKPSPVVGSGSYLTSAEVDLRSGEHVYLDRTSAGWRISAVGCQAQPGGQPDECEVQS
jgi:hypothetical protein